MNILFVTTDDVLRNSSSNIRNVALIKGLTQIGHRITIACLCHGHKDDPGLRSVIQGVELVYLNKEFRNIKKQLPSSSLRTKLKCMLLSIYNKFRIFDQYVHYRIDIPNSIKDTKYDLLISSSDPRSSHVLAKRIRKCYASPIKWVQYWGDPMANDISSSRLVRPLIRMRERQILNQADVILYTNHQTVDYIKRTYGLTNKNINNIPTSFPLELKGCGFRNKGEGDKMIHLGYFGEYKKYMRNMDPLFEAVLSMEGCVLTLAGNTDYIVPNNHSIIKHPHLTSNQLEDVQSQMDILVVVENRPAKTRPCVQIPGKIFHYGLTNQKILVISENGIIEKEFDQYKRYKFCENTKESIAQAVCDLVNEKTKTMYSPVPEFYPEAVARKFEKICAKC